MIHIDGAQQSGSGTIVRFAVAFAALLREPLHVTNARAKRPQPGLRPQHVAAVRACADLCGAVTEGVAVGAREFQFRPGAAVRGGVFRWDIGTAGSTTMLALGLLPLACVAGAPITARITGGVFQDFAPSPYHMRHVLAPLLGRMGVQVELEILRAGYVPSGAGEIELRVRPAGSPLAPLSLTDAGTLRAVSGVAFSSHLAERRVSARMAHACEARLADAGVAAVIECVEDSRALRPGACLAVWGETSTGCLFGADRAGAPRRSSEAIGQFVADCLLADIAAGATVDRHLADQLVLFAALAGGVTEYVVPAVTAHVQSNLSLAEQFGAHVRREGRRIAIEGLGLRA